MNHEANLKVKATHLGRDAYLYVRQSTLQQVVSNTESAKRQYALRERAVALGWEIEQVVVIDCDTGQSGASAADREGFQKLVADVGLGKGGIVLGLEVSRLARNSTDWHRLLEICALTDTLIMDEDGVYDPGHFNDRLLLGLKGTMSEAELHILRARLQGGILNKARRGELELPLPVGFIYDNESNVVLEPDIQVQQAIRLLFDAFGRTGSACAVTREFGEKGLLFPGKVRTGPNKGEITWGPLVHDRVRKTLHNPRYAGAFSYGKCRNRKSPDGKCYQTRLPREEWKVLIQDAHPGYISWEEYEQNEDRLKENSKAYGHDSRKTPPGKGPALLQGIAVCGKCGERMTVRYHERKGIITPDYMCQKEGIRYGRPICQYITGWSIDLAIGEILIEAVSPLALEVALSVQEELKTRAEEADRLRMKQVERAQYEADLARRRYMMVDPGNRLVADQLEADWNHKLRELSRAQEEYERSREADLMTLGEEKRSEIMSIAADFPKLWGDPNIPDRERKRMVRLILEDVTLVKDNGITMQVRFRGGATLTKKLPRPLKSYETWTTAPEVIREIDRLLDEHTESEVAAILNERGMLTGAGLKFDSARIAKLRFCYGLKERFTRLRERGLLTVGDVSKALGVHTSTINRWRCNGVLKGYRWYRVNDRNEYMYEPIESVEAMSVL